MVSFRSYVGDKNAGNFFWDDIPDAKWRTGNLPRRILPADWYENLGIGGFWFVEQIESGAIKGKQIDWSGWGAEMTGMELLHFWDTMMCPDLTGSSAMDKWRVEEWQKMRTQLVNLDPDKAYILTVAENA